MPDAPTAPQGMPNQPTTTAPPASTPPSPPPGVDWTAEIPHAIREEAFFTQKLQGKTLGEALEMAYHADKEVGRRLPPEKAFQIPTDMNSPEWDRISAAIRPADPKNYTFKPSDTLKWDADALAQVQQVFWDAGIADKSAGKVVDLLAAAAHTQAEAEQRAVEEGRKTDQQALRTKFGALYDEKIEIAHRTMKEFSCDEYLEKLGLMHDPNLVPVFVALGTLTSEGRFQTTPGLPGTMNAGGQSPEAIQREIDQIRSSDRYKRGDPSVAKDLEVLTGKRMDAEARLKRQAAGF